MEIINSLDYNSPLMDHTSLEALELIKKLTESRKKIILKIEIKRGINDQNKM